MLLAVAVSAVLRSQSAGAPVPTPGHPLLIPTKFLENRFVATPITLTGKKLLLYTDSAATCSLNIEVAHELKLPIVEWRSAKACQLPAFRASAFIPSPIQVPQRLITRADTLENVGPFDGLLGAYWFDGRTWTLDYPAKKLYWRAQGDLPKHTPDHETKLYFKTDAKGERQSEFARIQISVDGEPISFTVDTGAEDLLPPAVMKLVNDGRPAERATSFLAQNVFDKWHAKHPDWKVIPLPAESALELIEVPKINIGGFDVGPVWFSVQSDKAFHEYMAQWTDQPTEGSIGGSAFKYLRMTLDWPDAVAVFEKPISVQR